MGGRKYLQQDPHLSLFLSLSISCQVVCQRIEVVSQIIFKVALVANLKDTNIIIAAKIKLPKSGGPFHKSRRARKIDALLVGFHICYKAGKLWQAHSSQKKLMSSYEEDTSPYTFSEHGRREMDGLLAILPDALVLLHSLLV